MIPKMKERQKSVHGEQNVALDCFRHDEAKSKLEFELFSFLRLPLTSPAETVEPESWNHTTLNHDVPDSSVSLPWQPDTLGMESSFCDDNWLVDGTSDENYELYLLNDGIYLSDLWSFD
ncbi:uncharacterized protein J3R85_006510 [Psidium guajava]|nr:uncharacterized protein J3R85_006510 [Psidium guajava]